MLASDDSVGNAVELSCRKARLRSLYAALHSAGVTAKDRHNKAWVKRILDDTSLRE